MKTSKWASGLLLALSVLWIGCGPTPIHLPIPEIATTGSPNGVVDLPEGVLPVLSNTFVRYTKVVAPNGKPIHIFADHGWSDERIVKARQVLEHILTDSPGTRFGADKTKVANAMADRRATLVLFETEETLEAALAGPLGWVDLGMQDLRANECPVEGDEDYMAHRTRDASYEEVLHMVHDYGIKPVLPEYQAELQAASDAATARGIWRGWPDDEPENHSNEYLGVLYDNYLDLWWPNPTHYEGRAVEERGGIPAGQSHFGRFHVNSRAKLLDVDPVGYELIEAFFPTDLTYTPELPPEFEGAFSLELDAAERYTSKSRHLTHVTLTGDRASDLIGNQRANRLTGNVADNRLRGNGGDDWLDGGSGEDTASYAGPSEDYEVLAVGDTMIVDDRVDGRDGRDVLVSIERLVFADGPRLVSLEE